MRDSGRGATGKLTATEGEWRRSVPAANRSGSEVLLLLRGLDPMPWTPDPVSRGWIQPSLAWRPGAPLSPRAGSGAVDTRSGLPQRGGGSLPLGWSRQARRWVWQACPWAFYFFIFFYSIN